MPMSHELVRERPTHTLEQERPHGMLDDAAVPYLQDVVQVIVVAGPAGNELVTALEARIGTEAEVAHATRKLCQHLAGDVRIAVPADVRRSQKLLTSQQRDLRLPKNLHRQDSHR